MIFSINNAKKILKNISLYKNKMKSEIQNNTYTGNEYEVIILKYIIIFTIKNLKYFDACTCIWNSLND